MKKNIKTIFQYSIVPIIIIGIIFGWRACKTHDKKEQIQKEIQTRQQLQQYKQKLCLQPFLYLDKNGVYHLDSECRNLHLRYMRRHRRENDEITEDIDKSYSAAYISKDSIHDWFDFAATHQLCSECFSPQLIHTIDSIQTNQYSTNALQLQYLETDDERYRDADEEYYNMQDDFNGLFK